MMRVYGVAVYQKVRNKKLECIFCYRCTPDTIPCIRSRIDEFGDEFIEFDEKEIIPDTVKYLNVIKTDVYLEIMMFKSPFFKLESKFFKLTDVNAFVEYGDLNWKYSGYSDKYVLQSIAQFDTRSKDIINQMEARIIKKVREISEANENKEEKEMTDYKTISTTKITTRDINAKIHAPIPIIKIPEISKIVFSNPATIVFWSDGTKTVVKCMEGQGFNEYYGVACAIMKRFFGNNSKASAFVEKFKEEEK